MIDMVIEKIMWFFVMTMNILRGAVNLIIRVFYLPLLFLLYLLLPSNNNVYDLK